MNKLDTEHIVVENFDARTFKRGEIWFVNLEDLNYNEHVQSKNRPALIIQNDVGNSFSQTLIIAPLTSQPKKEYPFHYHFQLNGKNNIVMFEQILTISKSRMISKIGELTETQMYEAEAALMYSLGIKPLSFERLVDMEVESIVTKKTATNKITYFVVKVLFDDDQSITINANIDDLAQYDSTITKDTDFDELKLILNCCSGLRFLFTH